MGVYTESQLSADLRRVDGIEIPSNDKFALRTALSALQLLHSLSKQLGKPLAEITSDDLIADFERATARGWMRPADAAWSKECETAIDLAVSHIAAALVKLESFLKT
jgi:hypothetical protein